MMKAVASSAGCFHGRSISQPPSASSSTSPAVFYFSSTPARRHKHQTRSTGPINNKTQSPPSPFLGAISSTFDDDRHYRFEFVRRLQDLPVEPQWQLQNNTSVNVVRPDWVDRGSNKYATTPPRIFDHPISGRINWMMKTKQQKLRLHENCCCSSTGKAFGLMVFMILELKRYMEAAGIVSNEDLEMQSYSLCWVFQHILSCNPGLMVSVMLLLANFTVHSVAALSAWKSTAGEARRMQAETRHEALMERVTLLRLVSPVKAEMEGDEEYPEYRQTEEMYWNEVEGGGGEGGGKTLFLSNYAEFLYRVVHDNRRAEYYYRKAIEAKPADAEALSGYANFLWFAKKDLVAAEETYLEAIAADPGNNYHGAKYAHFLWNTGGHDTCYCPMQDE